MKVGDTVYVKLAGGVFKGKIYRVLPKYPFGLPHNITHYEVRGDEFITITPKISKINIS